MTFQVQVLKLFTPTGFSILIQACTNITALLNDSLLTTLSAANSKFVCAIVRACVRRSWKSWCYALGFRVAL